MSDWPPNSSVLKGTAVTLEPLRIEHVEALQVAVEDGRLWEGPFGFVPRPEEMSTYVAQALKEADEHKSVSFAVRLNDPGTVVGTTRFFNIQPNRRRMEIGFTWFAQSCQRSVVNTECKLLLLEQAFDVLNCIAIAWLVHSLNFRSREAVQKLGAKLDGVMRNYLVMPDGTLADLAVYSVTRSEWPAIKVHLAARAQRLRKQKQA